MLGGIGVCKYLKRKVVVLCLFYKWYRRTLVDIVTSPHAVKEAIISTNRGTDSLNKLPLRVHTASLNSY